MLNFIALVNGSNKRLSRSVQFDFLGQMIKQAEAIENQTKVGNLLVDETSSVISLANQLYIESTERMTQRNQSMISSKIPSK